MYEIVYIYTTHHGVHDYVEDRVPYDGALGKLNSQHRGTEGDALQRKKYIKILKKKRKKKIKYENGAAKAVLRQVSN